MDRPILHLAALLFCVLVWPMTVVAKPVKILAFGDSLTAGYGLPEAQGFTRRLEAALKAEGIEAVVINAGVSGDTSAGGVARLDWALADRPEAAILELGANDGLRGLDTGQLERNLDVMLTRFAAERIPVLFAGMLAPPNFGADYGAAFRAVYERLTIKHKVLFYPFFLDGVAGDPTLNQPDGLHPTARGVEVIVARVLPLVRAMVGKVQAGGTP